MLLCPILISLVEPYETCWGHAHLVRGDLRSSTFILDDAVCDTEAGDEGESAEINLDVVDCCEGS